MHAPLALLVAVLAAGCAASPVPAPPAMIGWVGLRDDQIVRQAYDYSCGAAALATLLSHYFDDPVDESTMLELLLEVADIQRMQAVEEVGFSLLDLKRAAEARGYRALGVRVTLEDLRAIDVPAVVYLETADYKHFAVLRGISDKRVYLADPARGNIRLAPEVFVTQWPGIALLLEHPDRPFPEDSRFAALPSIEQPEAEVAREAWRSLL